MNTPVSPVFTACISEFILHETQPPSATALSGLELRLFIPNTYESVEKMKPREHILQLDDTNIYNHFFIRGMEDDCNEVHTVCMQLMKVRDTLFKDIIDFINLNSNC